MLHVQEENTRKIESLKADNKQRHSYHNNIGSIEAQLAEEVCVIYFLTSLFFFSSSFSSPLYPPFYFIVLNILILVQQEALERLRHTFTNANYDCKIEDTVHEKQEVDRRMVEMGEVMKMLTLHSSSRVRLGIKKSEAQAKQAAYDTRLNHLPLFSHLALPLPQSFSSDLPLFRLESKRLEINKLLGHTPEPTQAKTELQFLLGYEPSKF